MSNFKIIYKESNRIIPVDNGCLGTEVIVEFNLTSGKTEFIEYKDLTEPPCAVPYSSAKLIGTVLEGDGTFLYSYPEERPQTPNKTSYIDLDDQLEAINTGRIKTSGKVLPLIGSGKVKVKINLKSRFGCDVHDDGLGHSYREFNCYNPGDTRGSQEISTSLILKVPENPEIKMINNITFNMDGY